MSFNQDVNIAENERLRIPQREGWQQIANHYRDDGVESEVGIVLPVGCGKSGLISLSPYAASASRVLVIAPGTRIRDQLGRDLRANSPTNFYARFEVMSQDADFPEVAVVQSGAGQYGRHFTCRPRRGEHSANRGRRKPMVG